MRERALPVGELIARALLLCRAVLSWLLEDYAPPVDELNSAAFKLSYDESQDLALAGPMLGRLDTGQRSAVNTERLDEIPLGDV